MFLRKRITHVIAAAFVLLPMPCLAQAVPAPA
jgi:hypothetical protein